MIHASLPSWLWFVMLLGTSATPAPAHPNLLVIVSDDQRWDALGASGHTLPRTPLLDQLAREGVYFRQATTISPLCAPSRASLLTGLAPHSHGVLSNHPRRHAPPLPLPVTLPQLLGRAGYRTVLVGKWHLKWTPRDAGFDDVRAWLAHHIASKLDPRLNLGDAGESHKMKGFTSEILADQALGFLESPAAREGPFLLWLSFTAPHLPTRPLPERFTGLFAGAGIPVAMQEYLSDVSHLDEQVGRVLEGLDRTGLAERTAVVFLSDNGHMKGEQDVDGKVVPWDASIRVPLILRYAGLRGQSDAPVSTLDVPATLLEIAGVPRPQEWPGHSLLDAARGKESGPAIVEWNGAETRARLDAYRVARTARHKLLAWQGGAAPALYDLTADAGEARNRWDDPVLAVTRAELLRALRSWSAATRDPAAAWLPR